MPKSSSVTLKQLRYFSRIVELGSISRASSDLNIAQTALGLQVRALEYSMGTPLLIRNPKGVEPTEEGLYVYEKAIEITQTVDVLVGEVRSRAGSKKRDIWLGLAPNIMCAIGTEAARRQEEELPGIRLHLFEASRDELLARVDANDLDWAIVHELDETDRFFSIPLLRQSVVMVSRPGTGLPAGPIHLRDVLTRDLVLDSGKRVVSSVLIRTARELGLQVKARFEIDSVSAIKQMILQEDVSGFFNRAIVEDEVARGELEIHEIVDPPLEITANFVTRRSDSPNIGDMNVLKFIDRLLDDYCGENPSSEVRLNRLESIIEERIAS